MKPAWKCMLVVIWIQLSSADHSPDFEQHLTIQPPKDKRYQLFNFIARKTNEATSQELLERALTIYQILQHGNLVLESQKGNANYDSQAHQDLQHDLLILKRSVENLENNKFRCDLQQEVDDKMFFLNSKYDDVKIKKLINIEDKETMDKFKSIHDEYTKRILTEFRRLLGDLYDQLPEVIEKFLQSLNANEREDNAALVKWCQDFLAAASTRQKYFVFQRFATFYLEEEVMNDGNDSGGITDCKWDKSNFEEFIHKMLVWAQPPIPGFQ